MTGDGLSRGGAPLGHLSHMDAWEADCILNLRLWCEGKEGHDQVRHSMLTEMGATEGQRAFDAFSRLVSLICQNAYRPLVRHSVTCSCVGADECVFCHIVRLASSGHLHDAALTANLLVGPAFAEHVALLAGEVGRAHRETAKAARGRHSMTANSANLRLH